MQNVVNNLTSTTFRSNLFEGSGGKYAHINNSGNYWSLSDLRQNEIAIFLCFEKAQKYQHPVQTNPDHVSINHSFNKRNKRYGGSGRVKSRVN